MVSQILIVSSEPKPKDTGSAQELDISLQTIMLTMIQ